MSSAVTQVKPMILPFHAQQKNPIQPWRMWGTQQCSHPPCAQYQAGRVAGSIGRIVGKAERWRWGRGERKEDFYMRIRDKAIKDSRGLMGEGPS